MERGPSLVCIKHSNLHDEKEFEERMSPPCREHPKGFSWSGTLGSMERECKLFSMERECRLVSSSMARESWLVSMERGFNLVSMQRQSNRHEEKESPAWSNLHGERI